MRSHNLPQSELLLIFLEEISHDDEFEQVETCYLIVYILVACVTVLS